MRPGPLAAAALTVLAAALTTAQTTERLDLATIAEIRDEGLNRSQVMEHVWRLSEVYGPRLTGGPQILQASDWAIAKFTEWGLSNARREPFPFGRGWSLVRFSAHMIEPQVQPLIGFPGSWSPGTNGTVAGEVVSVRIASEADFARYQGKLAGKFVLTQPAREVQMLEGTVISRMGVSEMAEAMTKVEGFPIQTTIGGMSVIVHTVGKASVAPGDFEVPAGFKKVPFAAPGEKQRKGRMAPQDEKN